MLLWVNQDRGRFFCNGVIVGPLRQDISGRVPQINLDPLVRRKVERNGTLRHIRQRHFDLKLADLGQPYSLRRDLEVEREATQSRIFVLRYYLGRKGMQNAAQPTPSVRCRRRRGFLAQGAPDDRGNQKEQNNVSHHERA